MENYEYIEHDKSTIFYCLFFAIFYDNIEIVGFLTKIVNHFNKESTKKADQKNNMLSQWLIESIEIYGLECLRNP